MARSRPVPSGSGRPAPPTPRPPPDFGHQVPEAEGARPHGSVRQADPWLTGVEGERCRGRSGCGQVRDGWLSSCYAAHSLSTWMNRRILVRGHRTGSGLPFPVARLRAVPTQPHRPGTSHAPVPTGNAADSPFDVLPELAQYELSSWSTRNRSSRARRRDMPCITASRNSRASKGLPQHSHTLQPPSPYSLQRLRYGSCTNPAKCSRTQP